MSRIGFDEAKTVGELAGVADFGIDMGVYKCSPLVFQLIKKIDAKRPFSWHRLTHILNKAGRGSVYPLEDDDWGIVERPSDIETLTDHKRHLALKEFSLCEFDQHLLGDLYRKCAPIITENDKPVSFWVSMVFVLSILGTALIAIPYSIVSLLGVILLVPVFIGLPVVQNLPKVPSYFENLNKLSVPIFISAIGLALVADTLLSGKVNVFVLVVVVLCLSAYWALERLQTESDPSYFLLESRVLVSLLAIALCVFMPASFALIILAIYTAALTAFKGIKNHGLPSLPVRE